MSRLAEQIAGCTTIVALSKPAIEAVKAAHFTVTYHHQIHPGMLGLNNYFRGLGLETGKAGWRVEERCRLYALEVIATCS